MSNCQYCGKELKENAVRCINCKQYVNQALNQTISTEKEDKEITGGKKWYKLVMDFYTGPYTQLWGIFYIIMGWVSIFLLGIVSIISKGLSYWSIFWILLGVGLIFWGKWHVWPDE